jgi:DNA-binding NarL/FixJ family response regulator
VLDIGLPGRGGLEVLKEIKHEWPRLPVLILSMHPEAQYAVRAIRAGAAGYLTKEAAPEKLLEAIRRITAGGRFIGPDLADRLAIEVAAEGPAHASLSDREFEVLRLIGSGLAVGEIAERLSLSVNTVSTYRARVLEKMRMKNNAELMHYVVANRLLEGS